jgi:hypothetical protein
MIKRRLLLGATASALLAVFGTGAGIADNYNPSSEAFKKLKISAAENEQAAALGTYHTIAVIPDDEDWATAQPTTLFLPFHLEAEVSKNKWRVKDSFITIGVAPIQSGGQLIGFAPANYAARVEHGDTKHFDKDGWWTSEVSANNSLGARARNACRNLRKELAQQGMKHAEIFSQDRNTILPTEFRYSARVAHHNDYYDIIEANSMGTYWMQTQPIWANINVICKKGGASKLVGPAPDPTPIPTGSNDIAMGFQVNQAALAISPKPYTGRCPAKIHLNPTIEATGKGTVKYRFVDQLGNHSQQFQVKFDKSDIKFLDHVIEIESKGKPKGLGFAAPQQQGGALGLAAPTDPNLVQGYFRVEVLSPHKKLSNIADYSVKCTFKVAGNGELAAPKDVVKPVVMGDLVAGLADLWIEQVQPSPAVPTKLFVKVTNKGKAASTPTNLRAIRWTGGQATGRGTLVPAVQPGQSQVVLAELGGTIDGATQLYLRVDDPNRIPEQNEKNNSFKVK